MDNFVTYLNFNGSRNVPNLDKAGAATDFDNSYIAPYQKEILIKLLDYDEYLKFETGLAVTPVEDIEAKWTNLKNGCTYVVDGINKQNPGLINIVANYVFCKWLTINHEQVVGVGSISSNTDNATIISPENKITNAWNEMIRDYYKVYDFMMQNETDYPNQVTEELRLLTYGF